MPRVFLHCLLLLFAFEGLRAPSSLAASPHHAIGYDPIGKEAGAVLKELFEERSRRVLPAFPY